MVNIPSPPAPYIDVNNPDDIKQWSRSLGATTDGIRHAIAHVGASSEAVQHYLLADKPNY